MGHFSDLKDSIKDVRIPTRGQEAKSAIAYVELADEPSFEVCIPLYEKFPLPLPTQVLGAC